MSKHQAAWPDVPPVVNSNELETELLEYWEREQILAKSLDARRGAPLFSFYDGPPYATGKPHYGHILQSSIKDTVLRYKTMQGYLVPRRVGWDCHGLPVENLVERELGLKTKREIEKLGIGRFNQACREVVFRYINDFTAVLKRIGRWADYEQAYATLEPNYMESEWWVFKQLWEQDLVYKAFRTTPYCVRCATPLSNHEVVMAYKEKKDTAVYVLLSVVGPSTDSTGSPPASSGSPEQFLLVWTTTPWTLPGNAAVAINPDLSYVAVPWQEKKIIVAAERAADIFGAEAAGASPVSSQQLLAMRYKPLYPFTPTDSTHLKGSLEQAYRVVPAAYVTAKDGSGLVHMAPGFGEEDAVVGEAEGLPVLRTVDGEGRLVAGTPWPGEAIEAANAKVGQDLRERGLLFKEEIYTHNYPFCWRCDTPLIYYALDTWFIRVQALKERMRRLNQDITWVPAHVKEGRFAKGIESAPDWAVSRNRFWSVPLPVWECEVCGERMCVGSIQQLKDLSGVAEISDLHRPLVDEITWSHSKEGCTGTLRRVPEVLDVWFDAGSMPYAQWHYPFENRALVERSFPADFIAESIEMTRAWFYVLHVLATAMTTRDVGLGIDKPAFKAAIASGLIFGEDGQKLSKKLKNYPEPLPMIERYGADILRFYLLVSTSLGEAYRFSERELRQVQRQVYLPLWNVYSFFVRYANLQGWSPSRAATPASPALLDRWIKARLLELRREVIGCSNAYQIDSAARAFPPFIDDLSNWYVRRSRAVFQKATDKAATAAACDTLYYVLVETVKLLAPFMPFVTENMYRTLTHEPSVHLASLPKDVPSDEVPDAALLAAMAGARRIVSEGLALRAQAKIKIRQPLHELVIEAQEPLPEEVRQMIADELNVKTVTEGPVPQNYSAAAPAPEWRVGLDTTISPELKREGIGRDIVRQVQVLRKEARYALNDRIVLTYVTSDSELKQVFVEQGAVIAQAVQADAVVEGEGETDVKADLIVGGKAVQLGAKKTIAQTGIR